MKDKNIIREAEKILNVQEVKQAVKDMEDYAPIVAKMTMDIYKAFIGEGFTEEQAFTFAKDFTLVLMIRPTN